MTSNINIISADFAIFDDLTHFCDIIFKEVSLYYYPVMLLSGEAVIILVMLST